MHDAAAAASMVPSSVVKAVEQRQADR